MDFLNDLFADNFIYGFLSSLLATFVAWGCRQLYVASKYKSDFNGKWEATIIRKNTGKIETDILTIRHDPKTGKIKGTVIRPDNKEWKARGIMGILMRDRLLTISYTNEPIKSMSSTHTVLVGDYHFKGYLLRYNLDTRQVEEEVCEIKKMPKAKKGKPTQRWKV